MRRNLVGIGFVVLILVLGVVVVVFQNRNTLEPQSTPTLEPVTLLTTAANNIRTRDTFRLYVEQGGAAYNIWIQMENGSTAVKFEFAKAQYVAPDMLQATARVLLAGLAIDIGIFSKGPDQWYQLPGLPWVKGFFAPGFNPATLIAEDTGFQAALTALTSLEFIGETTLEDGTPAYHLKGIADGPSVTALVVGLIQAADIVPVDVFINRETLMPVRLILTQPETVTETEKEPTTWTIDVYDLDAPSEVIPPDDALTEAAATAEITATEEPTTPKP